MVRPNTPVSNHSGDYDSDSDGSGGETIEAASKNNEPNGIAMGQGHGQGDSSADFEELCEMPMLGEGDSTHDIEFEGQRTSGRLPVATRSESRTSFFSSKPFQLQRNSIGGINFGNEDGNKARRFASDFGFSHSPPQESSGAGKRITSNDEPKPNLIVNYLPQNFSDKEFFHLFAPYGVMESIKIMRDSQTGYSFGYGFVNYIELQDAIDARNELNGKTVGHKRIKVSFARPPSDDIKDTNLFVTGLSTTITEEELDQMFSPFGVIVHLRVLRDRLTKATRGVAFVRYETRSEACTAILDMNGIVPSGATEPIRVRLAQDHGKQKAAYLAGYQAALKMKGGAPGSQRAGVGAGVGAPEAPYRHSESSFNLHPRNVAVPPCGGGRGRPSTPFIGEGIRITSSSSDPTLYWKGFLQGARVSAEPSHPRRPEASTGRKAGAGAPSRDRDPQRY